MEALALQWATSFHIFVIVVVGINIVVNLLILFAIKDFCKLHKFMWFGTPIFFGSLAISLLSGFSVWAMIQFAFSLKIILMLMANLAIIVLEIYRIKKLRQTRKNPNMRSQYIYTARFLYIFYLLIFLALWG